MVVVLYKHLTFFPIGIPFLISNLILCVGFFLVFTIAIKLIVRYRLTILKTLICALGLFLFCYFGLYLLSCIRQKVGFEIIGFLRSSLFQMQLWIPLICFLVCIYLLGDYACNKFRIRTGDRLTGILTAWGLGSGIMIFFTFLLASIRLLYPILYPVLFIVIVIARRNRITQTLSLLRRRLSISRPWTFIDISLLAILFSVLLFVLILASFPPISHDGLSYHLNVPGMYIANHGFEKFRYNTLSNVPFNTEMLYTALLLFGNPIRCKLLNFIFGLGVLAAIYAIAGKYFNGKRSLWPSAIFLVNYWTVMTMSNTYVEIVYTFYALMALWMILNWIFEKKNLWLILSAIFSGLAFGCKYTGAYLAFILILFIFASLVVRKERQYAYLFKNVGLFVLITLALASPWLIKNLVYVGNPIFPMFRDILGGKDWSAAVNRQFYYGQFGRMLERTVVDYILLPWNISINGGGTWAEYLDKVTPLWLMLAPLLLIFRRKKPALKYCLIYAALFFLVWTRSRQQVRDLFPIFPVLSIMAGLSITNISGMMDKYRYKNLKIGFQLFLVISLIGLSAEFLSEAVYFLPAATRVEKPEDFLADRVRAYPISQFINDNLEPDAGILFMVENRTFYCRRYCYYDDFWRGSVITNLIYDAGSSEGLFEKVQSLGITHIAYWNFPSLKKWNLDIDREIYRVAKEIFEDFREQHLSFITEKRGISLYQITKNSPSKRKLLDKQKKGKKKMLSAGKGSVEIPPETFVKILKK